MFSECVSECVWICYFFPTFNLLVYTYYLYAYLLIHTPFGEAHFVLEWKSNMVSEKKHLVIRTKVHHSKTHHNGLHSHTHSKPAKMRVRVHSLLSIMVLQWLWWWCWCWWYDWVLQLHIRGTRRIVRTDSIVLNFNNYFDILIQPSKFDECISTWPWVYAYRFGLVLLSLLYPC